MAYTVCERVLTTKSHYYLTDHNRIYHRFLCLQNPVQKAFCAVSTGSAYRNIFDVTAMQTVAMPPMSRTALTTVGSNNVIWNDNKYSYIKYKSHTHIYSVKCDVSQILVLRASLLAQIENVFPSISNVMATTTVATTAMNFTVILIL